VVSVAATILCVGAKALRVGQALAGLVIAVNACSPARPAGAAAPPDLVIPRLDGDAGAAALGGDGARFGHPPTSVGAAWTVETRATSRSPDGPAGAGGEQVSLYESTYRVEVLAVAGPAPSRVKLHFLRNVHSYQGRPTPTAIDGKEYVVDARAPHVRDPGGAPAATAESDRVLDIFPDLGTRARVDEVMPDDALPIGARHDDLAVAILRVIHPRAWTLRSGTATLVRVEDDHAVFKITLDAASETRLRLEVAGEARVRLRDARLSELALEGRYERLDPGAPDPPGTFEVRRTVTSEGEARSAR
jgi:hypothetical protein